MDEILGQVLADSTVSAIGTAIAGALIALWLAAAWWAYTDAARRTDSIPAALLAAGWIVVSTPLMMPLALAVYALARPQQSAAEDRTRRLASELIHELEDAAPGCPSCGVVVDPAWMRCPACTTWLALPCAACGTWSDGRLAICPYCGAEERNAASVEAIERAWATGRPRRGRRSGRAMGPGRPVAHRDRAGQRRPAPAEGRPHAPLRVR